MFLKYRENYISAISNYFINFLTFFVAHLFVLLSRVVCLFLSITALQRLTFSMIGKKEFHFCYKSNVIFLVIENNSYYIGKKK